MRIFFLLPQLLLANLLNLREVFVTEVLPGAQLAALLQPGPVLPLLLPPGAEAVGATRQVGDQGIGPSSVGDQLARNTKLGDRYQMWIPVHLEAAAKWILTFIIYLPVLPCR